MAAAMFALLQWSDQSNIICWTAAITTLCAVWWILEPIPIPATSLIPLAAFPVLGILTPAQVGSSYGSPVVLLLLGGFLLSAAVAASGAHRRMALAMVNALGGNSHRSLVFGFMATSALLSMWITNTATTLMLLPIALAILQESKDERLTVPLLLGIAYAASVGGIGTPIGTPPNLIFREVYQDTTGIEVGFLTWMSWGLPLVILFIPIIALWLTRNLTYKGQINMPKVGQWHAYEKRVLSVFAIAILAWVTRSQPLGGWSQLLDIPNANDTAVALLAAVAMFLIPNGKGGKLLDWDTAVKIPWGVLILFGAGIAIAKAFASSGLSEQLGILLSGVAGLPIVLVIAVICLGVTFMTELTSNTATAALMMPILAAIALATDIPPELLMVPAVMSVSCAFMLPVATPPNTMVFSTGRFTIHTMVREGFFINLIGVALITAIAMILL